MENKLLGINNFIRGNVPLIILLFAIFGMYSIVKIVEMRMVHSISKSMCDDFYKRQDDFEKGMNARFNQTIQGPRPVHEAINKIENEQSNVVENEDAEDSPEKIAAERQKDRDFFRKTFSDKSLTIDEQIIKTGLYETYPFRAGHEQMKRQREALQKAFESMHKTVEEGIKNQEQYINSEAQKSFGVNESK